MVKKRLVLLACILLTMSLFSCKTTKVKPSYYSFTCDNGGLVALESMPTKVVSLFGSYTDLWLLAGGTLVGATDDAVTERELTLDKSVKIVGTVKAPNLEIIFNLSADFVLLSTDIAAHHKIASTLKVANISYAFFKEDNVDDYLRILKIFTEINARPDLLQLYAQSVAQRVSDAVQRRQQFSAPKVLLIRSMSTTAKALKDDHMVGIMLKQLNTNNIALAHSSLLQQLSMETIIYENPDYIFAVTMGDYDKAVLTLKNGIMAHPSFKYLKAVKNENFYILPKQLFQYKPNSRWGESYEYLEKILCPKI